MRINTTSCFLAVKYAAPAMMKPQGVDGDTGGSIIMTASVAGLRSGAGPTHCMLLFLRSALLTDHLPPCDAVRRRI